MSIFSSSGPIVSLGFMSGTSLDGVDVALIRTDGVSIESRLGGGVYPYARALQDDLRTILGQFPRTIEQDVLKRVEDALTHAHLEGAQDFLEKNKDVLPAPEIVGFHGQTIFHKPPTRGADGKIITLGKTFQIGNPVTLSRGLGLPVVYDFRTQDIEAGGQGAPLVPAYHQALFRDFPKPLAIVNVGGISNITWLGERSDEILAFDVGPGNAPLNDFIQAHTNLSYDPEGSIAAKGKWDKNIVDHVLSRSFFREAPPKSLDRNAFSGFQSAFQHLSCQDGAATWTKIIVEGIVRSLNFCPQIPRTLFIAGGGAHNITLMSFLKDTLSPETKLQSLSDVGFSHDLMEAEAFAFLAVRSVLEKPLSYPTTTGVPKPQLGGRIILSGLFKKNA